MSRLSITNLALLLAVAGLGTLVYFKPSREESTTHALSTRLPAQARSMRIEREGSPAVVVEKKDEIWRITAPIGAEADAEQVQRLLAILAARSTQRFDASRLERFELERPRTRLVIDGESFAFGVVNAVSGEQYVLTSGAVYAIGSRYGSALPLDATQLARKQLLSSSEIPIRFEMGEFSLRQEEGKWLIIPAREPLSQDDLARWVGNWHLAAASRVAPLVPRPASTEVRIGLMSGASVALDIVQREPELVIARHDEKLQYHFPPASARRLLAPPAVVHDKQAGKK
jgi:hypothetical protein